ncbi:FliH/SctL family protein [Nocardioides marmoribigeumensis]|uniref:Flagellar assembly protein FliH n=1 Tax=Nocardioides marmoribigeumensis TaxID=433649 RepID=A0ABU2BTW9_9ACTN|nr:FliH/SctL family protein [Nocardioides marmoribigeumensis]MDR7362070.1 flagellar assembly protein FliH [Nocardioides marmoribigeumensis]
MTSSSPELARVVPQGTEGVTVRDGGIARHELRGGEWTRFGGDAVRGDAVTEGTLAGLVDQARTAAQAQGFSTGWAEGRRAAQLEAVETARRTASAHAEAEARREAEHQAAVAAVQSLAEQLAAQLSAVCAHVEARALDVALTLTEELLGHELTVAEDPARDAVRRALALLPDEPVTRVRVSPLDGISDELRDLAGTASVVADPSLGRGEVMVHAADVVVDGRVSGAMARVREVLS